MSCWTELFVGKAESIGHDLQREEPPTPDLELHGILPEGEEFGNTLEVFTEAVCKALGQPLIRFRDCVARRVAGENDELAASFGANVLSRQWVQLIAGLTERQRGAAARQWVKEWNPGAEQPEANSVTRESGAA